MPGETKDKISGWTVDTLHAHVQTIINERDRLVMALLSERDERYKQRFDSQTEAVHLTAEVAKEAKAAANEWRSAMKDREVMFLPRSEFASIIKEWSDWRVRVTQDINDKLVRLTYEREHKTMIDEVSSLRLQMTNWFSKSEGRGKGLNQGWGYIVGGAGFIVALISIFLFLSSLGPKVEKMDAMRQQGMSNKEDYYQRNGVPAPTNPAAQRN